MPRLPYSAKILADEVRKQDPDAEIRPVGPPDGLGVFRVLRVDGADWLPDVLRAVDSDPRIVEWNEGADGVEVRFVHTVDADRLDGFGVGLVRSVLEPAVKMQPAKKAAAKKSRTRKPPTSKSTAKKATPRKKS